nr:calpain-1 catalytic subunit [Crassostrea gigas]XP_034311082.1 calpain-1 catalytic subunit [Crassostrea gigas]
MEISQPRNAFRELFFKHASEDGKLEAKELKEFISELSRTELNEPLKFSTETCRSLVTMMDRNRSGGMNYGEALKMWREIKEYIAVFQQFDVDKVGEIKIPQFDKLLRSLASTLGFPVNRRIEMAIVRRYADRDDKIRLQDFIIIICKLTLMHQIFKEQQAKSGASDSTSFSMNEFLYYTMYC